MESPVHENLKSIRTALKLSQRDFAKGILLEQSSYARLETGKSVVSERIIELVCSKYGVNKVYLKIGKGKMFSETPPDAKLEQLSNIFNELTDVFQDCLIAQAREILKAQQKHDS
jgi:transcriptional regulator with XRE-family HTH domain